MTRRIAVAPPRSRLRAGALAAFASLVVAVAGVLALATPASAAASGVLLSADGVTFSSTYSGALFGSTTLMVPQSTQSGRFWVKNDSSEPAYLRVSVKAVSGSGTAFSGAVSLRASTPVITGPSVPVDAALPCYVLNQGQVLAPGAVARIDIVLAVGDLTGTSGQNANLRFDILAGLSSAATGSLPATTCLIGSGTVPGTPGTPGGGGGGGGGHTGTPHTPGTGTPADAPLGGDASGIVVLPDTPDSAFADHAQSATILRINTDRLYQEWFVLLWVAGALAGGGARLIAARRRAAIGAYDEDDDHEQEVATWQGSGRIDGRRAWSTT